jgi:crotonobetainyl-CoA:carnitine CoA-transferase CaiB-like acyl-CoA transferase
VLERLGVHVPERAVRCAITGFGSTGPHARTVGHDVNYLGFAGVLEDTAPMLPPGMPLLDSGFYRS